MTTKINKKIRSCEVVQPDTGDVLGAAGNTGAAAERSSGAEVIQMHESLARPETLVGATYKIKSPLFEHALYVTVNDIILNGGTEHEQRRPFEIFINSKSMDQFQWIVALTRIMSAVFRKGGDVTFLVEEMKAVFDPRGGYFQSGGVYMPSIVAELGAVLEQHMRKIGMLRDPDMSDAQRALIAEKRAAFKKARANKGANKSTDPDTTPNDDDEVSASGFPPGAAQCSKCNTQALVLLDGCQTCLNCGYSKCG